MDKTFEKIYEEYNKESAPGGNQALFEKVYAEAEMLNEMNPKLKALLAAGLIGTAGLGMQSCSNPSDSVYYPYTVEAPSTDNPGSGGGTENLGNGGDGGETVEEVTFSDLGVTDEDDQKMLRHVIPTRSAGLVLAKNATNHIYMGKEKGFEILKELSAVPPIYEGTNALRYIYSSNEGDHVYYIPANMKTDFIKAGANLQ